MATSDERIAIAIDATKNTQAIGATVAEVRAADQAIAQSGAQAAATVATAQQKVATAAGATNVVLGGMPVAKLKEGAQQIQSVAFAAQNAALGGKEAIAQMGNLTTTLLQTGIAGQGAFSKIGLQVGVATTLVGTFIALAVDAYQKWNAIPEGIVSGFARARMEGLKTVADIDAEIARARQAQDAAHAETSLYESLGLADEDVLKRRTAADARVEALVTMRARIQRQEREDVARTAKETIEQDAAATAAILKNAEARGRALQKETWETLRQRDVASDIHRTAAEDAELAVRRAERAARDRDAEIAQMFELQDLSEAETRHLSTDKLEALRKLKAESDMVTTATKERIAAELEATKRENAKTVSREVAENGTPAEQHAERLRQIDEEYQKNLELSRNQADRDNAERLKKQQTRAEDAKAYGAAITTIDKVGKAAEASGVRQIKAVRYAADAVRRFQIAVKGKEALVDAKHEGALAIGSAADGNFAGAALHGASAIEHAAAAAYAFAEAGGGGGGASAGGGGGGAGAGGSSFVRDTGTGSGQGATNIYLITRNPYGRDEITQAMYLMRRADGLNVPINVPPTTGVAVSMGRVA